MIKIWENPNAKNYFVDNNGVGHMPEDLKCLENHFEGCNDLTHIVIPKSVKKIANSAFYYCVNLKYVLLPEGLQEIGNFAFARCVNLLDVNIPGKIKKIGNCAFLGCKNLQFISIPQDIEYLGESAFTDIKSVLFKNVTDNFGLARVSDALSGGEYKIKMGNDTILATLKGNNKDIENV